MLMMLDSHIILLVQIICENKKHYQEKGQREAEIEKSKVISCLAKHQTYDHCKDHPETLEI